MRQTHIPPRYRQRHNRIVHDPNVHVVGECVALILCDDGSTGQLLYVNDRGQYSIDEMGGPTFQQRRQMAERLAMVIGVRLQVIARPEAQRGE